MFKEEIKKTLLEYYEAFHNKNWSEFAGYLTDNFSYYTDKSIIMNKKKFADFLSKDRWHGKDYKVYDIDIFVSEKCGYSPGNL